MKYVISILSVLVCLTVSNSIYAEVSCECPKLACDPCSAEQGITFYTEKCGPRDIKLKSCARPTCIPIEEATKECPVPPRANSGPREPIVVKQAEVPKEAVEAEAEAPSVGKVKVIQGSVSIIHADGKKSVVTEDADLKENDTIEAAKDGGAVVDFKGGNKMHVHADTTVQVQEFKNQQADESRKAIFHLIKGKIRNQVEQKYNGKTSYFRVNTKSAVAGVRGTDFVMEFADKETKIQTIGGKVWLAGQDEKEVREINKGQWAKFNGRSLSPVYKIPDDQMEKLDRESRLDIAKAKGPKVSDAAICDKPRGLFNQCAWNFEGGSCVRRRCNGNGAWAEETKLPSISQTACPPNGYTVKDCDY